MHAFGSSFKGFDDSLADWGSNRMIKQFCGQTWLSSLAEAGKHYSSSNQLDNLQLVTWNDYEEGTELETGIDNCVSVTASIQGRSLAWSITGSGSETTIDHYSVFISSDGQNLMPLAEVAAGNSSLNLDSFDLGAGPYTFYVKAVGKPSIVNQMSNAVRFPVPLSIAVAPASLSLTQGGSGSLTVKLTPQGGSFDQPVAFSCSGLPAQGRCSFSPASLTPGAAEVTTTLTIFTAGTSAARTPFGSGVGSLYAVWMAGLGLVGTVLAGPESRKKRRVYFVVACLLALTMLQLGCGSTGSNGSSGAGAMQSGTYSVVVTGTSAGQQFSTTATVTVH
jgi:hypothetical protein